MSEQFQWFVPTWAIYWLLSWSIVASLIERPFHRSNIVNFRFPSLLKPDSKKRWGVEHSLTDDDVSFPSFMIFIAADYMFNYHEIAIILLFGLLDFEALLVLLHKILRWGDLRAFDSLLDGIWNLLTANL